MTDEDELGSSPCDCPRVIVNVVAFSLRDGRLLVLLVRRPEWRFGGDWSLPGRLVGPDEALEAAAISQLEEHTGHAGAFVEQLYTFGEPRRDPRHRVLSVAYYSVVSPANAVGRAFDDRQFRWWSAENLPATILDHGRIVGLALARLRRRLDSGGAGLGLVPQAFTLTELQAAHEIVLGASLDKRNFRRRIHSAGQIEPVGRSRAGSGRPARLYRYRESAIAQTRNPGL